MRACAAAGGLLLCVCAGCGRSPSTRPRAGREQNTVPASRPHRYTNRLSLEKSPYLLQHAHNPVDWYPWGEEAFEKAREENKPVFLSIGYSTCHWCHVMEKESFKDERVAAVLNRDFVPVKVDREERPDIDRVYMNVCLAMNGSGGWPLTIVMTPGGKPFFAATYIPRHAMAGRPGIIELLGRISDMWESDPDRLIEVGEHAAEFLGRVEEGAGRAAADARLPGRAFEQLRARFDAAHGGFGGAPKFPSAHTVAFLLRWWKRTGDAEALSMAEKTLSAMARGGINDHVGFGFHRYSVDATWLVPHFEKMLYDQAMLAVAYTEAWQATGKEKYRRTAQSILTYVLRDMRAPGGAFYSAEDADSEGEEGKFYVWRPEQVAAVLGKDEGALFCRYYGISDAGNFEGGASVLHEVTDPDAFAEMEGMSPSALAARLEADRKRLLNAREMRARPQRDDKILADWNGLMIEALAKAARAFGKPAYAHDAARAADFVLETMRAPEGGLLHRFRDGEAAIPGYLDDYAFMVRGLIALYETTLEPERLGQALSLTERMIDLFRDDEAGGFFFSGRENEKLIARLKDAADGAYPSGNSVAAMDLLMLARMTGADDLRKRAERLFEAFSGRAASFPAGYTHFLAALQFASSPGREVVIAGRGEDGGTRTMLGALGKRFLPDTIVIFHPEGTEGEEIERIAPFVKGLDPIDGRATAYVCRNYTCSLPTTSVKKLEEMLDENVLSVRPVAGWRKMCGSGLRGYFNAGHP